MVSSITLGQKSPSKYGISVTVVISSSVQCRKSLCGHKQHETAGRGPAFSGTNRPVAWALESSALRVTVILVIAFSRRACPDMSSLKTEVERVRDKYNCET